jgi:hypothetical protein
MKGRVGKNGMCLALVLVLAALFAGGCPDPAGGPGPVVYTVTVSQPANGGAIGADPASGPVGIVVTLSNTPATDYTFSHYTVNGARNDGNSFTLDKDAAVNGVVTPDENSGDVPIASLCGGSPARRGIPEGGGTAVLDIGAADRHIPIPRRLGPLPFRRTRQQCCRM